MFKKTSLCWALSLIICTTNRNCNMSEISILIFMSVTLTYSRRYAVVVRPPLNSVTVSVPAMLSLLKNRSTQFSHVTRVVDLGLASINRSRSAMEKSRAHAACKPSTFARSVER
jgi:hypothetical protein